MAMRNVRMIAEKTTTTCVDSFFEEFKDKIVALMRGEIPSYRYDVYSGRQKHFTTSVSTELCLVTF